MAHIKTLDTSRPVSANAHNTLGQNGSILDVLDVMGLTYDQGDLDKMHAERPLIPLMNGESASCQSDMVSADSSAVVACSQASWAPAAARLWDAGAFVWSGFDYRFASVLRFAENPAHLLIAPVLHYALPRIARPPLPPSEAKSRGLMS